MYGRREGGGGLCRNVILRQGAQPSGGAEDRGKGRGAPDTHMPMLTAVWLTTFLTVVTIRCLCSGAQRLRGCRHCAAEPPQDAVRPALSMVPRISLTCSASCHWHSTLQWRVCPPLSACQCRPLGASMCLFVSGYLHGTQLRALASAAKPAGACLLSLSLMNAHSSLCSNAMGR